VIQYTQKVYRYEHQKLLYDRFIFEKKKKKTKKKKTKKKTKKKKTKKKTKTTPDNTRD
tara:strand:- start:3907 stop:4080 length:174 start_codon:yes stop_codon:yes gene_type:complete